MNSNLFINLRMEQNEVVMCRFLADLLDPKGWHGCGTKFLKSFLNEFVKLENVKKEEVRLESTCVMAEYLIDNGRRIDIMLQNPAFSVPIEAKINARDQRSQCYDYHSYARNAKLVYLTKGGFEPSEWSRKSLDGKEVVPAEEIRCISWNSICEWLEKEPGTPEEVRQYTEAVRSFLSKHKSQQVDYGLLYDVLESFRRKMGQGIAECHGLDELRHAYRSYQDWNDQELSFCPGLNYRVNDADWKNGLQMWFRIEVADDGYLSAGFCLVDAKGNKVNARTIAIEDIKQMLDDRIVSRDDWWLVWRFSNGKQDVSRDDVPNFKTMNRSATDLRDPKKREIFVDETIQIFRDQLWGYLKPSHELFRGYTREQ